MVENFNSLLYSTALHMFLQKFRQFLSTSAKVTPQ